MSDTPVRMFHIANSLSLGGTDKVIQLFVASLDRTRFIYSFLNNPVNTDFSANAAKDYAGAINFFSHPRGQGT